MWRADRQRKQQTAGRGTFVPLMFRAGEAFQFDWSEDHAVLDGGRTKLQVAHIKLSHSRAFLLRAYLLQSHEMLSDAHWHGFRVFGGVPARGIYHNLRTTVDRVGRGKERQVNIRFLAMANHYVFAPEFCNPASGWEKGQVEKNVQDARPRLWQPMPTAADLAALNAWLERRCQELWHEIPHGTLPGTIADVLAEEQAVNRGGIGCRTGRDWPPGIDRSSHAYATVSRYRSSHLRLDVGALFLGRSQEIASLRKPSHPH